MVDDTPMKIYLGGSRHCPSQRVTFLVLRRGINQVWQAN